MENWLGPEGDQMRIAFSKAFGSKWRIFGNPATQIFGYSDGKDGVQWQAGYNVRTGRRWAGVNLEGMQYDDWPIAPLIERELKESTVIALVKAHGQLAQVEALWRRDFWQVSARPEIVERVIAPTPIALADLTEASWKQALTEARQCLDNRRRFRARAVQTVTLPGGEKVDGEVSPHLTFRRSSYDAVDWQPFLQSAKADLEPLHRWTVRRAALTIGF